MNIWVLIVLITSSDGNSITTQEFYGEQSCASTKSFVDLNMTPNRLGVTKTGWVQK